MVDLALDGGVGQDLGGLLEGGGGQPGLRCQRRLRDAHEDEAVGREPQLGLARVDAGLDGRVGVLKLEDIDHGAAEQRGIAGILDA